MAKCENARQKINEQGKEKTGSKNACLGAMGLDWVRISVLRKTRRKKIKIWAGTFLRAGTMGGTWAGTARRTACSVYWLIKRKYITLVN